MNKDLYYANNFFYIGTVFNTLGHFVFISPIYITYKLKIAINIIMKSVPVKLIIYNLFA